VLVDPLGETAYAPGGVRVDDVSCPARGKETSDVDAVHTIKGHDIPTGLPNESRQPDLTSGIPNRLSQLSAQRRSSAVNFPPVALRAPASTAPHSAASSSATSTARAINPEMLGATPESTSRRRAATCDSSRVIVTFCEAMLTPIPSQVLPGNLQHEFGMS
jgi:hypothetical protein